MKKATKNLTLRKELLRQLTSSELAHVVGGVLIMVVSEKCGNQSLIATCGGDPPP
jgi:hypothetical protein